MNEITITVPAERYAELLRAENNMALLNVAIERMNDYRVLDLLRIMLGKEGKNYAE